MAARKSKKTTTAAAAPTTRTKRTLADRVKKFDLDKLLKLKANAEETIRTIAAEGLRREEAYKALKDTSVLDDAQPVLTKQLTPNVTVTTPYAAPTNGRSSTTSP